MLVVLKEGEANPMEVSRAVVAAVEKMQTNPRLEPIGLEVFFNQGDTIMESLGIMLSSGRVGGLIAALVLLFFLRRFRMTLIITLSIPLSLMMGIVAMYFFGETLNIFTLLGLMISVGLLVDNSVVVAENIFRLHRAGLGRREAVVRGAGEISLAIVMGDADHRDRPSCRCLSSKASVSSSCCAWPSRSPSRSPASLLVALVFVPLSVYLTLPEKATTEGVAPEVSRPRNLLGPKLRDALHRGYDASFGRLNHGYNHMLGFFLHRRVDLVMVIVLVAAASALPFKQVKFVPVQEEERAGFEIDFSLPQSTTLERSRGVFPRDRKSPRARAGRPRPGRLFHRPREYLGRGPWLAEQPRGLRRTPRGRSPSASSRSCPRKRERKVYTGQEKDDEDEDKNLHIFTLLGEDAAELEQVAERLEELFTGVEGVLGLKKSGDTPAEELAIRGRPATAPSASASIPRWSRGWCAIPSAGRALPKFYRDGREIPVRIRYQEEDRESLAELYDFQVPAEGGQAVSLASVTTAERLDSAKRIWRRNKQTARTLTFELEEKDADKTRRRLKRMAAGLDLPEGVKFGEPRRGGGLNEDVEALRYAALAFDRLHLPVDGVSLRELRATAFHRADDSSGRGRRLLDPLGDGL